MLHTERNFEKLNLLQGFNSLVELFLAITFLEF